MNEKNTILLYPECDQIGKVEYIDHMGDDAAIVDAARASLGLENRGMNEKDIKLINYLMENRHTSPFEQCEVKFRFVVPLFVARQHMRHRTFSFNELSRRYTAEDIKFFEPKEFRTQHKSNLQASNQQELINPVIGYVPYSSKSENMGWRPVEYKFSDLLSCYTTEALKLYNLALDNGICREQARMILPQNMYTTYIGKCNLHNLFHFLNLRTTEHVQLEMRKVAFAIQRFIEQLFPVATMTWAYWKNINAKTKKVFELLGKDEKRLNQMINTLETENINENIS